MNKDIIITGFICTTIIFGGMLLHKNHKISVEKEKTVNVKKLAIALNEENQKLKSLIEDLNKDLNDMEDSVISLNEELDNEENLSNTLIKIKKDLARH